MRTVLGRKAYGLGTRPASDATRMRACLLLRRRLSVAASSGSPRTDFHRIAENRFNACRRSGAARMPEGSTDGMHGRAHGAASLRLALSVAAAGVLQVNVGRPQRGMAPPAPFRARPGLRHGTASPRTIIPVA